MIPRTARVPMLLLLHGNLMADMTPRIAHASSSPKTLHAQLRKIRRHASKQLPVLLLDSSHMAVTTPRTARVPTLLLLNGSPMAAMTLRTALVPVLLVLLDSSRMAAMTPRIA